VGRADFQDPQRCGGRRAHEQSDRQRGLRQAVARGESRRPHRGEAPAGDLFLQGARPRFEPPARQERARLLPQHHAAGGARQAQRAARNHLRLPRPRHRAPHQKGAPRPRRADGGDLLRRRGVAFGRAGNICYLCTEIERSFVILIGGSL